MDIGNDGLGVYDALVNVENNYICVYRKLGLNVVS